MSTSMRSGKADVASAMRGPARVLLCALAVVFTAQAPMAAAQVFPSRPIELIVHTNAGGGSDLFTRTVAEIITREKLLAQPVVVVNKGGGGGAIAFQHVAGKRGDPYTLLSAPSTVLLTSAVRSGLDLSLDRFTPLGMLGFDLNSLAVREDAPYAGVKDFVEAARREPASIVIAVGSFGGTAHYLAWRLEKLTGARFKIVSMRGGQAVTSVLGGHVHATTENLSEVVAHVEARKMRLLGVPAAQRMAAVPGVATFREQGFDVRSGVGRGFASPADVPKESPAMLEAVLVKAHQTAAWKDYAARNVIENVYLTGAEFGRYLAEKQPEMVQFMRDVGLASGK